MNKAGADHNSSKIDRRLSLLIAFFVLGLIVLTGRLFYLQIVQHQHLTNLALKQQERTIQIQPTRGSIYDRQGRPLAINRLVHSFYAVPDEVKDKKATAVKIAAILGISEQRLLKRFQSKKDFVWVKRKVSDEAAAKVKQLNAAGIRFLKEAARVYPEGSLASHVIGFVGLDNQGLAGIELALDHQIKGDHGWIRISRDACGQTVPTLTKIHKPSEPGKDIYLTIDKVVQHIAEQALDRGLKKTEAKFGSIIVMKPDTGEILAMANKPDYDPNHFNRYPAVARKNRAIVDVYEPGSTFKIVTGAAALEEGIMQDSDVIDCENGKAVLNGIVIRDHEPRGRLSFRDVLVFSSNIGAVKIGMRLGGDKLYHYTRQFGFGKTTGIELPGEADGLLQPVKRWKNWRAISTPFGQGVAVTTLQMATAFAALANEGRLMRPWIVKTIQAPDGSVIEKGKTRYKHQVISSQTADKMKNILSEVVTRGTGEKARISNYPVVGKTGTAQKPRANGKGYDDYYHVGSFIGFFPEEDPKLLISVVIDSPKGIQWGGLVAGPIFNEVGQQLVAYLGIPPGPEKVYAFSQKENINEPETLGGLIKVPDCRFQDIKQAQKSLQDAGLKDVSLGKGRQVVGQRPSAGALINEYSRVVLYLDQEQSEMSLDNQFKEVVVPNLKGQSMRNAIQITTSFGLNAKVVGSGIVSNQTPEPYARVMVGQACQIKCQDPECVD